MLNKKQAQQRIEKLRKVIDRNRYLYHVLDKPEISDAAHDSLKHELAELEAQYPDLVTPDSPTQRVGGKALAKFSKVRHTTPVLSLQDAFSAEEVAEWKERNEKLLKKKITSFFCEFKFDGLSVVLAYRKGVFAQGATRGDGYVGEDVTQNLKTIESIPLRLRTDEIKKLPPVVEVRGEAVMSKKNFEALNAAQKKKSNVLYANPRNIAAGSIRQLDPTITSSRKLDFFAFELITDCGQTTQEDKNRILRSLGFKVDRHSAKAQSVKDIEKLLTRWHTLRNKIAYNLDGAVIKVNDIKLQKQLGSVGKSDRWMLAYKFPAEQVTTRVQDIIVQVGRTGALTPVAILEPVQLAGTTVSRATLHNEDEIKRLDVRIGDTVILQKAGDIIPDVVKVLPKLRTGTEKRFYFPTHCTICGSKIMRQANEVARYCSNPACYAQEIERLVHFVSKKGFYIEGMGEKIVRQLVAAGLVQNPADFFKLKVEDLEPLERFAERSAQNIIASIKKSRNVPLSRFIYALGIRHVGEETSRELANHFTSLAVLAQASVEELEQISDIGPVVAQSAAAWFEKKDNQELLKQLKTHGVSIRHDAGRRSNKLDNKTFVITGTLSRPREQIAQGIRLAGGRVSGSVSSATDFVVAGENPGSKYDQAVKLKVPIISEDELTKLMQS